MEKFENSSNYKKEIRKGSDIEIANFFIKHIDNPCGVKINGKIENIRTFYIREAKKALEKMTNPFAIELLKKKIQEYEKDISL